jgi:hypothetical protein
MKTINILSQKTAVLNEKESRNSIRPIIEEAWFWMEYNDAARILSVLDWKEQIAQIVWVKWVSDFANLSRYYWIYWAGWDLAEEVFFMREWVNKVLETWIWECRQEYLMQDDTSSNCFEWIENCPLIYTKSPNSLRGALRDTYKDFIDERIDALEWNPDYQELSRFLYLLDSKIQYSDSPDTFVYNLGLQNKPAAWWEIVDTGKSADALWLKRCNEWLLTRRVSTDIYTSLKVRENQQEVLDYFIERIKNLLPLW